MEIHQKRRIGYKCWLASAFRLFRQAVRLWAGGMGANRPSTGFRSMPGSEVRAKPPDTEMVHWTAARWGPRHAVRARGRVVPLPNSKVQMHHISAAMRAR